MPVPRRLIPLVLVLTAATVWLAPGASAMVPPPEPTTAGDTATTPTGAIAVWQVVAIALVAVLIGAVGTMIAQRVHRGESDVVSTA